MQRKNAFLFFEEAKRGQHGQVAAFLIIIMVIILVAAIALIQVGKIGQQRVSTANAADAAALAGASTLSSSANMMSYMNNELIAKYFFGTLLPSFFTLLVPVDFRKENGYFAMYLINSGMNILIYLQLLIASKDAITQAKAATHQYAFSNAGIEEAPQRSKKFPDEPIKQRFSKWMDKPENCDGGHEESLQDNDCFKYTWTEHTFVPKEGVPEGGVQEPDPAKSSWIMSEATSPADGFNLQAWPAVPVINKYRYYYIPCCKDIPYINAITCSLCGIQLAEWKLLVTKMEAHDKKAKYLFLALMSVAAGMGNFQDIGVALDTLYTALGKPLVIIKPSTNLKHKAVDCAKTDCKDLLKSFCGLSGDWLNKPGEAEDPDDALSGGQKDSLNKCLANLKNLVGGITGEGMGGEADKKLEACNLMWRWTEPGAQWQGWIAYLTCMKDYFKLRKQESDYTKCKTDNEGDFKKIMSCIIAWKKMKVLGINVPLPYYEVTVIYMVPLPFIVAISNLSALNITSTVTRHSPVKDNLGLWKLPAQDVESSASAQVEEAEDSRCAQRGWLRIMPCYDLQLDKAE